MKLRAVIARDDQFDYGDGQWDLIVVTYVRDLNQADADRFWIALKPGGMVVYENGVDESNAVLRAFLRYQIVRFEDVLTSPEWNPQNHIRVQRLIAQKTLAPARHSLCEHGRAVPEGTACLPRVKRRTHPFRPRATPRSLLLWE